jgi:hypothetical protein
MYTGPLVFGIVPIFMILMFQKGYYSELLIGFWFIIILSDSYEKNLVFAKDLKNIYILFLAAFFLFRTNVFSPVNKFYISFVPYFISSLISIFLFSPIIETALQKYLSYFLLFLIMPNYIYLCYKTEGEMFLKKLVYFFISILLISIVLKYFNEPLTISHGGRFRGIFGNPNGLALFTFICFILLYAITKLQKNIFTTYEKYFYFGIIILASIWSGSRNVNVAIFIFVVFVNFFEKSLMLGFITMTISLMLFELIGSNYIAIIQYFNLEEFFRLETLDEGGGRYIAWNFAWNDIQDNFFLGKGFAWDEKLMKDNYKFLSVLGHEGGVHNSYLIMWLNSGLVGLLLYFIALISKFIKANLQNRISFPIMISVFFTISFEPWLVASLNPYTLIFLTILTIISDKYFYEESEVEEQKEVTGEENMTFG